MLDPNLTATERGLLEWLGESESSKLGECLGRDLDRLVELGLAQVHVPAEHQSATHTRSELFWPVSLTAAGRALVAA